MPGGILCQENLEQRIERIRKRDEEIEKKHREAEADRLAALQANAMVNITAPTDEDWPKEHKYDKLDFTYDVKPDELDEMAKKNEETRLQRAYKKFPEGQGPPADPTYNFLADAERDGINKSSGDGEKKEWRSNNSNTNRRTNSLNNSFNRGRHNGGSGKGKNIPSSKHQYQQQKTDSSVGSGQEPKSWRNERDRVDGKWRREWDNDKSGQDVKTASFKSNSATHDERLSKSDLRFKIGETVNARNISLNKHQNEFQNTKEFNSLPQKISEMAIEKRGNITVSLSQDGEVKSVRCK